MAKKRVMVEMVAGLAPQLGDVLTWGGEAWEPRPPGPRAHRLTHVHTDRLPQVMMGDQESPNFEDGVDGWRIRASGDVQLNDVVSRGTIYSEQGEIGGWIIGATSLTAGSITLESSTPDIAIGGATAYMTGTGIWMGNDGGTYKMHIGDPDAKHARWDGEAMYVSGLYSLEGPLLVCRYDGPYPFETDFSGNPNGHFGQIATKSGGVIFRPGRYGKGVQIAEATTNLVTNPSFETGTTGWVTYGTNTIAQSSEQARYGSYSLKCTYQDAASLANYGITLTAADHTCSIYVYIPSDYDGTQVTVYLTNFTGGTGLVYGNADMTKRDQWQRLVGHLTPDAGDLSGDIRVRENGSTPTAGRYIYVDAVQCEAKAYVTPYCDGSLGDGHSWSGTAHASTSSRTAASLDYDDHAADLVGDQMTICGWYAVEDDSTGYYHTLVDLKGADNNNRTIVAFASGGLHLYLNGAWRVTGVGAEPSVGDRVFWCVTLDYINDEYIAYVYDDDGTGNSGSSSASLSVPTVTALQIGRYQTGASNFVNGVLDDLAIFDRVLTADEIDAIYHSGGPLQVRTSNWEWRLITGLAWADEDGLWVVDADGNEAFGVCAVDGKSWGGKTLDKGDALFGREAESTAWMLWDQSVGDLSIGVDEMTRFLVDASEPLLKFGADVSNVAKTALVVFGADDITYNGHTYDEGDLLLGDDSANKANAFWDRDTGKIQFRGGTTMQVEIDTDGTLLAGGGVITMGSGGLSIIPTDVYATLRSYYFTRYDGTGMGARLCAYDNDLGEQYFVMLEVDGQTLGHSGIATVKATADEDQYALVELEAACSGVNSGSVRVYSDGGAMGYDEARVEIFPSIVFPAEISDPDAPAANQAKLYIRDNGSGKTQLCARFSSGAVQVLATQP